MAELCLRGVRRGGWKTTTTRNQVPTTRLDLVDLDFTAERPN